MRTRGQAALPVLLCLALAAISFFVLRSAWIEKWGDDTENYFRISQPVLMWGATGLLAGLGWLRARSGEREDLPRLNPWFLALLSLGATYLSETATRNQSGWESIVPSLINYLLVLVQLSAGAGLVLSLNRSWPRLIALLGLAAGLAPWGLRAWKWSQLFLKIDL
jgi:hypothetical protein